MCLCSIHLIITITTTRPSKRRKVSHWTPEHIFLVDRCHDIGNVQADFAIDAENESFNPSQSSIPLKQDNQHSFAMDSLQRRIEDLEAELAREKERTQSLQMMLKHARGETSESVLANIGMEPTKWQKVLLEEEGLDVRHSTMPEEEIPLYVRSINQLTPFTLVLIDSDSVDNQVWLLQVPNDMRFYQGADH